MKKWRITVIDIKGDTSNESITLSVLSERGWELVSVVSLPLCRRAYLKREIPEEPAEQKPVNQLDHVALSAITNPHGGNVDSAHSTDYGGWA